MSKSFAHEDEAYKLKAEDVIALNIFSLTPGQFDFFGGGQSSGEEQEGSNNSSNQFVIDSKGFVELPALGDVKIAGLTIKEAQNKIRNLLEDYLKSPLVRISLQTPFIYSVVGEVNAPARHVIIGKELNIMEAIANAGDLTPFADRSQVRLLRKEAGEITVYNINLLDDDLIGSDLYHLKSEDVLIVNPLKARTFRENQVFATSTILGAIGGLTILIRLLIIEMK